jgi:hypothetical protein
MSGQLRVDEITDEAGTGSPAFPNGISANDLTSGTVATARLGSGTPDATTLLRGDGTWQPIPVSATTANVLDATAGASVGAVGTYAFCKRDPVVSSLAAGGTVSGSNLLYSNVGSASGSSVGAGTWMLMGQITAANSSPNTSLWLRIS